VGQAEVIAGLDSFTVGSGTANIAGGRRWRSATLAAIRFPALLLEPAPC